MVRLFAATTRRRLNCEGMLRATGVDQVSVDDGAIAGRLRKLQPEGFDKSLELVGTTTLKDSLQCQSRWSRLYDGDGGQ